MNEGIIKKQHMFLE